MADLVDAFVGVRRLNVSKLDKKGRKEVWFTFCCPVLNKNTACPRGLEGEEQQECHHKTEKTHGF